MCASWRVFIASAVGTNFAKETMRKNDRDVTATGKIAPRDARNSQH